MLTVDLIRVRVKGKELLPRLLDPTDADLLSRVGSLPPMLDEAVSTGWTRAQLQATLRSLEGDDADHRLIRGIGKVLTDRATFEVCTEIDPAELRTAAFVRAAQTGPLARRPGPTGRRTRDDVFGELAESFDMDGAALGAALYSDLKDEQRVTAYTGPATAEEIVHRYNVVLHQSLLLRATNVKVSVSAKDPKRLRQLVRALKFHQLMFRMESGHDGGVTFIVDGPQSLLAQNTRYGMQLANFFPTVLLQPSPWRLEAEVLWGRRRKFKKRLLISSEHGLVTHKRDQGVWRSNIEKWFEERFAKVSSDWTLEPGNPVPMKGQSFVAPDFTLRCGNRVGHLDIVGYWRKGYLKQRIAETPKNVVLAVSRKLAGDKNPIPQSMANQVVWFTNVIPVADVIKRVEQIATADQ